ncbi:hypothetical protein EZV62_008531 [Acer yangbiense]|uniref:Uncharacterized protein n=1 Tax=Acer yangbiense TaxID=1000413 RepID=A0A5C7IFN2_9ROSI|nr:hypothetical protein EZV62_008531 [Acer yangbiense]
MKHNNAHLESLEIGGCDSLTFIVKGQLPLSLKYLSVRNCEKLQYLLDDREDASTSSSSVTNKENINHLSTSLLENLNIYNCSSLTCLSTRGQLPDVKCLQICYCSNLKTLSSRGHLPATLENLVIRCCPKLDSIAERFCNNRSIERICIKRCANLRPIPEGLHSLSSLREIYIEDCPSLVFFPEGGLPDAIIRVSISRYKSFPSNLTSLSIEDPDIFTSLIAWGLHKLTSLRELNVIGCPDAISFLQEEMGMLLPTSLIKLTIARFPKLEYLSSRGFQNLFSLEFLWIRDCPWLTSFPEVGLPCSLLQLYADGCPLLKKHCKKDKGKEWSKISNIPCIEVEHKFIYDIEGEE